MVAAPSPLRHTGDILREITELERLLRLKMCLAMIKQLKNILINAKYRLLLTTDYCNSLVSFFVFTQHSKRVIYITFSMVGTDFESYLLITLWNYWKVKASC